MPRTLPLYRLVGRHPVNAQTRHGLGEFREIERLAHEAVAATLVASQSVALLVRRSQDDDWNQPSTRIASHPVQHIEAAHPWQVDVQQDHRGRLASRAL